MSNTNLHKAKKAKSDEFYTQLSDIEKELEHYKNHFKDAHIFCNCDDHRWSAFVEYFSMNFELLGLKKLTAIHYDANNISYKLEITGDTNGDGKIDGDDLVKTALTGDGDFRNQESIDILKECDIVVTNPPFSLFREYIAQLMKYDKKFLVVGPVMAMTYKEIFPLMQSEDLWIGSKRLGVFGQPDGSMKSAGALWFTTLDHKKRHESIILYNEYKESENTKYDNYDAIDCVFNRKVIIPKDYYKNVGVPITFMEKFNPKQFSIIRFRKGTDNKDLRLNGKDQALRVIIKRKTKMKQFMDEIEKQGVLFAQEGIGLTEPLNCDEETFMASVSLYEDYSYKKDDEDFMKLSKLLPSNAAIAQAYWKENNTYED